MSGQLLDWENKLIDEYKEALKKGDIDPSSILAEKVWQEYYVPVINKHKHDMVNHPPHYNKAGIEVIDVIDTYVADPASYYHGNVIKYMLRCLYKGFKVEDAKKAYFYLGRLIETWEKDDADTVPEVPREQGDK